MAVRPEHTYQADPSTTDSVGDAEDADRLLRIYLSDHRAGAAAGVARAGRFAAANTGSFLEEPAREVHLEIEKDVRTLDEIIDRMGFRPAPWKNGLARVAEFAGRLKPNGRMRGYSPLSRLIELELLVAGILTKESLWQTLAVVQQQRSELAAFDFDDLQRRAMQQRMQLEAGRRQTVEETFQR